MAYEYLGPESALEDHSARRGKRTRPCRTTALEPGSLPMLSVPTS